MAAAYLKYKKTHVLDTLNCISVAPASCERQVWRNTQFDEMTAVLGGDFHLLYYISWYNLRLLEFMTEGAYVLAFEGSKRFSNISEEVMSCDHLQKAARIQLFYHIPQILQIKIQNKNPCLPPGCLSFDTKATLLLLLNNQLDPSISEASCSQITSFCEGIIDYRRFIFHS